MAGLEQAGGRLKHGCAGAARAWLVLCLALWASSCTRAPVPNPVLAGWLDQTEARTSGEALPGFHLDPELPYAAFGIPTGGTLAVRDQAGATGAEIAQLAHDFQPIEVTGTSSALGSSLWVEILTPGGQAGWVQARHLTEAVAPEQACLDPRLAGIISALLTSGTSADAAALQGVISPHHGLTIRLDGLGGETTFSRIDSERLVQAEGAIDWQARPGTGLGTSGTFQADVIRPLEASLASLDGPVCNQIPAGRSAIEPTLPGEYANLNYLAFHVPQQPGGSPFVWHTWVLGFEYVEGQPYLALILRFQGEI